jgi:hypothetical protein
MVVLLNIRADFLCFASKIVEHSRYLLACTSSVVIALKVRRNSPQSSNFALKVRTRQSHCGSRRSGVEDAKQQMKISFASFVWKNDIFGKWAEGSKK